MFMDAATNALKAAREGEWLKDMRGNLAMMATVITTMTFQAGLNPPGGFVQNEEKGVVDCPKPNEKINDHNQACPGDSVYAAAHTDQYFKFMGSNSISFFASLCVCLWLVSGLPLNRGIPTLLLAMLMCISLLSLAYTYLYGGAMPIPESNSNQRAFGDVYILFSLVVLLSALVFARLVLLGAAVFTKRSNAPTTPSNDTQDNHNT